MRKVALFLSLIICIIFCSCNKNTETEVPVVEDSGCEMLILASDTPGSILAPMLELYNDEFDNTYYISVSTAADNIMESANGDYDLVILPLNMAYYLNEKVEGDNSIIGITKQGGISLVGMNTECKELADLDGKTVYTIGDTVMSFVFRYITEREGISAELNNVYSYSELIETFESGEEILALCEEPYVSYISSIYNVDVIEDINALWKDASGSAYDIPTEVLVVNDKFANANPKAVEKISDEYVQIITEYALNIDHINESGVTQGIGLSSENISSAGLCYVYGDEMIEHIKEFSDVMNSFDPQFTRSASIEELFNWD